MRIFFIICALLAVQQAGAQAYKDSIRNQFMYYNELLQKKEFAESMDYLNPAIYKVAPKDQLLQMIEQTFSNPEMEIKLGTPQLKAIEDSRKIDSIIYTRFEYSGDMSMRFNSEEAQKDTSGNTKNLLAAQFGEENVTFDKATGIYNIKVTKKVIANSNDSKKWTFLVVEERQKEMLEALVPKELL